VVLIKGGRKECQKKAGPEGIPSAWVRDVSTNSVLPHSIFVPIAKKKEENYKTATKEEKEDLISRRSQLKKDGNPNVPAEGGVDDAVSTTVVDTGQIGPERGDAVGRKKKTLLNKTQTHADARKR